jgi:hypothetical protein
MKLDRTNKISFWTAIIIASSCLSLFGCKPETIPKEPETIPKEKELEEITDINYHFYIVLSPINEKSSKESKQFLMNAKKNYLGKTAIFLPNNQYTIVTLCQGDDIYFHADSKLLPNDRNQLSSKIERITTGAEKALAEIERKRENSELCNASAKSLVRLSTNLYEAASKERGQNNKLIILIQAPWSPEEVETVFSQLKVSMSKLAKTNKVEKIFLFGMPEKNSDKTAKAFEEFNKNKDNLEVFSSASNLPLTLNELESIRKDILKEE